MTVMYKTNEWQIALVTYINADHIDKSKNNHDTIQRGERKKVRTQLYASITFLFLLIKGCTTNDRCPWDKLSSTHREDFVGNTGDRDTENGGYIRTVVNPYKRNEPREKMSYNTPLLFVRNPYKKTSSQKDTDTKQLSTMTHGSRVSTYYEFHWF